MLEKLRSRHPIDVPADEWGGRRPTLAILGGIALLFVLVPLLAALYAALRPLLEREYEIPLAVAVAFGAAALVLLVAALVGKPGHRRR